MRPAIFAGNPILGTSRARSKKKQTRVNLSADKHLSDETVPCVDMTGSDSRGAPGRSAGSDDVRGWQDNSDVVEVDEGTALLGGDDGLQPRKDSWVGSEDFAGLPWWNRPSVWWLMVPYSFFTLAFGGSIVPKLNLIMDLICHRYFRDRLAADPTFLFHPVIPGGENPECRIIPDVQKKVATFTLLLSVIVGLLSSLTAPKLGALSDRYGRKRLIVVCSFGAIAGEVIIILAGKYPDVVHYNWLLFGSVCDGLAGSFTAGSVLSTAYTADCTPPSKRSVAVGYLHACLFGGLAFGPLLASYFVKWTGSLLFIFYVTLGCHLFFIAFITFITPESLSKRRQMLAREKHHRSTVDLAPPAEWLTDLAVWLPLGKILTSIFHSAQTANPLSPLSILSPPGPANKRVRRNLLMLAFIDMGLLGTAMSVGTVIVLYTEFMFHWGTVEASRFISLTSMVRVVVLMVIFPIINYVFRTRPNARRRRESQAPAQSEKNSGADELDVWILRVALISDVIGITGYVFARTVPVFIICAVITAFGGLGSATIQSALSKHVPEEQVGQLLGAIGLLHSLARVISPIIFNGLYAATLSSFPQAFFVLLAGLFVLALFASFFVRPHVFLQEDEIPATATSAGDERSALI